MKKVYTAPKIYFESFTMSTNIAGDCDVMASNPAKYVCSVVNAERQELFFGGNLVSGCSTYVEDGYEGYCYFNPTETTNLFNS